MLRFNCSYTGGIVTTSKCTNVYERDGYERIIPKFNPLIFSLCQRDFP